jgi:hypothetical protein
VNDRRWLGRRAVLWVLDEAPGVPAALVSTLIALGRYAGEDGRGAYASAATIAAHTRKTERQAKRDLAELERLGLIQRGNQALAASIRADKRPVVYDLAMAVRGDTHDTPQSANGVTPMVERGDMQGRSGVSPMSPKEILNGSRKGARDAARAATPQRAANPAPRLAPPCTGCGDPFSPEELADPDTHRAAMASQIQCRRCQPSPNGQPEPPKGGKRYRGKHAIGSKP